MSTLQVFYNVALLNAWLWPFDGRISNSTAAYLITQPGVIFGGAEKNIWASKIAMILILYIALQWSQGTLFQIRPLIFTGLGLLCVLYTFGRTAQLAIAVTLLIVAHHYLRNLRFWFIRYLNFSLFILTLPILITIFLRFLRFDASLFDLSQGHQGDGFRARLLLWVALWQQRENIDLFFGNGILYGQYFFTKIVVLPNNNFHNVFINTLVDTGVIGLLAYIIILTAIFAFRKPLFLTTLLLFPLLVMLNLQYLGYDNDVVIYLAICWLVFNIQRTNLLQKS